MNSSSIVIKNSSISDLYDSDYVTGIYGTSSSAKKIVIFIGLKQRGRAMLLELMVYFLNILHQLLLVVKFSR